MSELQDKKLSKNHKYWGGYIAYADIGLAGLPPTIDVKGQKLLRKGEFHISLINAKGLAGLINPQAADEIEQGIIKEFMKFIKDYPLDKFKLLNEFRFVQKDPKKSVIVTCEVPDGAKFFDRLSKKYKKSLPLQPFHITLYTLQPEIGIGIISDEELDKISVPVEIPELSGLKTI